MIEGQTYSVLCGKEILHAKFVRMWDSIETGLPAKLLNCRCCRKCLDKLAADSDPWKRERYIYGIVSGSEEEITEAA
jgi:hypothetical protein